MTDSSNTIPPDTALAAQSAADLSSSIENVVTSKSSSAPEEQDYTIKCLCGLTIEEQSTICCEKCDTWQHTECYYMDENGEIPSNQTLDDLQHLCIDCQPRTLDKKGATERQRARMERLELDERRRQKPPSKSHKKKIKAPETNGGLTNGYPHGHDVESTHDRTSRSPLGNLPPAKRPKTSHRSSHSTNLPSLPQYHNTHKRSASAAQSPTKVPLKPAQSVPDKEICSAAFVHLYDNDPGDSDLQTNLLNDLQITNEMKLWSNDLNALHEVAPTFPHTQIFQRTEKPVKSMQMAELHKQERLSEDISVDGQHPKWRYLTVDSWTQEGSLVAEIKGKIGHMREYIKDPENRWDYLRHPEPFVFFHRHLPIYIDTRSEGTTCRYLRRSCIPNLEMKTFLENSSEYHFCFVATKDIEPTSELTIGWTTDEHMRRILTDLDNGVKEEELGPEQVEYMADWSSKVLLEFGGCACDGSNCAMTKRSKRVSISKTRNGYSSTSNAGYRMSSRDGSEQFESRSTSESKSGSRDMTPTENHHDSAFGTEISAREKRKIAALDKKFERLEEKPAPKKKKRNSGGSSVNTPTADNSKRIVLTSVSQPNTPGLSYKPQYADASTSYASSGSPIAKPSNNPLGRPKSSTASKGKHRSSMPSTPHRPSPLFRTNYVSEGMQTEPIENDAWSRTSQSPTPSRKPYVSLTKRLLIRSQHERQMLEHRRSASHEPVREQDHGIPSFNADATTIGPNPQQDVEMTDADTTLPPRVPSTPSAGLASLHIQESCTAEDEAKPSPPPPPLWPSQDLPAQTDQPPANGFHPPDLEANPPNLSEPSPNVPIAETTAPAISSQPPRMLTPSQPPSAPLIPPASSLPPVQPSPITKKLSLSEYFSKKRNSSSNSGEKSTGSPEMTQSAFKPPPLTDGDNKNNGSSTTMMTTMEGTALVDSPKDQRVTDPLLETVTETKEEDIS